MTNVADRARNPRPLEVEADRMGKDAVSAGPRHHRPPSRQVSASREGIQFKIIRSGAPLPDFNDDEKARDRAAESRK